jgi:hypothetical protein
MHDDRNNWCSFCYPNKTSPTTRSRSTVGERAGSKSQSPIWLEQLRKPLQKFWSKNSDKKWLRSLAQPRKTSSFAFSKISWSCQMNSPLHKLCAHDGGNGLDNIPLFSPLEIEDMQYLVGAVRTHLSKGDRGIIHSQSGSPGTQKGYRRQFHSS